MVVIATSTICGLSNFLAASSCVLLKLKVWVGKDSFEFAYWRKKSVPKIPHIEIWEMSQGTKNLAALAALTKYPYFWNGITYCYRAHMVWMIARFLPTLKKYPLMSSLEFPWLFWMFGSALFFTYLTFSKKTSFSFHIALEKTQRKTWDNQLTGCW